MVPKRAVTDAITFVILYSIHKKNDYYFSSRPVSSFSTSSYVLCMARWIFWKQKRNNNKSEALIVKCGFPITSSHLNESWKIGNCKCNYSTQLHKACVAIIAKSAWAPLWIILSNDEEKGSCNLSVKFEKCCFNSFGLWLKCISKGRTDFDCSGGLCWGTNADVIPVMNARGCLGVFWEKCGKENCQ